LRLNSGEAEYLLESLLSVSDRMSILISEDEAVPILELMIMEEDLSRCIDTVRGGLPYHSGENY